jgi:hypothetical protein
MNHVVLDFLMLSAAAALFVFNKRVAGWIAVLYDLMWGSPEDAPPKFLIELYQVMLIVLAVFIIWAALTDFWSWFPAWSYYRSHGG